MLVFLGLNTNFNPQPLKLCKRLLKCILLGIMKIVSLVPFMVKESLLWYMTLSWFKGCEQVKERHLMLIGKALTSPSNKSTSESLVVDAATFLQSIEIAHSGKH